MDMDLTSPTMIFMYVVGGIAVVLGIRLFIRAATMKREDRD